MAANQVPEILLGILLLVFGKKLFWLFVGIIGFAAGMDLMPQMFPGSSELVVFATAVTLGLMGAILAIVFQWIAIIAAGFLAGGYLLFHFFPMDSYASFFIGGFIGALLMAFVLDWALIIFSSLVGSELISRSMALTYNDQITLFVVLAVIGVVIQSALFLTTPGGEEPRTVKREK